MIIKDLEKWVHYNCPNCDSDISQEDADKIAQNLAKNLAQEKANNEVDIIRNTGFIDL